VYRLLAAIAALLLYGSLYPWHFAIPPGHPNPLVLLLHSTLIPPVDRFALLGIALNVAIYLPLGAVGGLALARRHSRGTAVWGALLMGFLLSASVEMLQLYVPGRDTSLTDVVTNSIGTAAGAVAALVFRPQIESLWAGRKWGRQGASAALLLACWAGYQLWPLIPQLSRTWLRFKLSALIGSGAVSPVAVWAGAAEWFAVAAILSAVPATAGKRWLAAALLCLPLRLLILGRGLSLDDLVAAALAVLLWSIFHKHAVRAGMLMLGSAILLRGLAPFQFRWPASAFSWMPFAASLASSHAVGLVILLRKAFDYGAAVWLLQAEGLRYPLAGAALAAVLAAIECVQMYIPAHTPEITDPLLALAMALALWRLSDSGKRRGLA
jgi:VanZ family protein